MEAITETDSTEVYVESLKSLKELRQLQSKFHQLERRVARGHEEGEGCRVIAEELAREVRRLQEEKDRLKDRISSIDIDIHQLTQLQQALAREQREKIESLPILHYESSLGLVNSSRAALGLPALAESSAYHAIRDLVKTAPSLKREPALFTGSMKSGPSYKHCPHCMHQVSRNAVTCPHCHALCRLKRKRRRKCTVSDQSSEQ